LAVVLYHCAAWGHTAMFFWTHRFRPVASPNFDQFGSLPYLVLLTVERLTWFSVPAFLFISGFSMAYATNTRRIATAWSTVGTRINLLFWPYLLYSLCIFLGNGIFLGVTYTPAEYLRRLACGQAEGLYYFVPLLIQLYLLSPFITRWAKRRPALLLTVAATIQTTMHILMYLPWQPFGKIGYFGYPWGFFHWALWFPLGAVCFLHYQRAGRLLARFRKALLAGTILFLVLSAAEVMVLFSRGASFDVSHHSLRPLSSLYALTFILLFLAFEKAGFPFSNAVRWLGTKSYGIYLLHFPMQTIVSKLAYRFAPSLLAHQVLYQPVLLLAGLGIPLLFMEVIGKSPLRKYYRYLFGAARRSGLDRQPERQVRGVAPAPMPSGHETGPLGVAPTRGE